MQRRYLLRGHEGERRAWALLTASATRTSRVCSGCGAFRLNTLGKLRLFRPNENFDRLKRSAGRVGLPVGAFIDAGLTSERLGQRRAP